MNVKQEKIASYSMMYGLSVSFDTAIFISNFYISSHPSQGIAKRKKSHGACLQQKTDLVT
jgi:hypothetical protein